MNISEINTISVAGISVRTSNSNEIEPSSAKIGPLWEEFYTKFGSKLTQNSRVFGLYSNYESDHTGAFDVAACSDVIDAQGLTDFQIPSGKYLVFSATGDMPQAVIDLWGEIWSYFDSQSCNLKRAFTTDFEHYKGEREIEIYIAVE